MIKDGKIKGANSVDIYYRTDIIDQSAESDKVRGVVVIVHGFAEHLHRYDYMTEVLNKNGYNCYRFDNRGHGRSGGEILDLEDFNYYIDDADKIVEMAKKENPNMPIFMLGHSMGGFITALYGEKYPDKLNGQILSGAATDEPLQMNSFLRGIIKAGNRLSPKLRIKNDLSAIISRDQEVVEKYRKDPLIHSKATMRFFNQFIVEGTRFLKENMNKYTYDCLILHGREDKIISYKSSENFYNSISSKNKRIRIYDSLYHEIFNEKEKAEVFDDLVNWLNEKTDNSR